MIGAGVYTSSGFSLSSLHYPWLVLVAWAVAGVIALLGSLCYGALARWLTASGGEYLFLSRAVSPLVGFMAGWVSLTAGFSGAIAFSAKTFTSYFTAAFPSLAAPELVLAVGIILFFGLLHLVGMSVGTQFQNLLVFIKLIAIGVFLVVGTVLLLQTEQSQAGLFTATSATPEEISLSAFATSVMWLSFSYAGYNAAVYVSGAASRPRDVANSMFIATVLVTIMYLALNGLALVAVPAADLAGEKEVFWIAGEALGGKGLATAVSLVILLSLATSVSAMLQVGPHVYAQMARDGLLPKFLVPSEDHSPKAATILQIILACLLTIFTNLQELLDYLAFVLLISSALTASILLFPKSWLRQVHSRLDGVAGDESGNLILSQTEVQPRMVEVSANPPENGLPRPWGGWVTTLLFVAASLVIALLALRFRLETEPKGLLMALGVFPIGLVFYWVMRPPLSIRQ